MKSKHKTIFKLSQKWAETPPYVFDLSSGSQS